MTALIDHYDELAIDSDIKDLIVSNQGLTVVECSVD